MAQTTTNSSASIEDLSVQIDALKHDIAAITQSLGDYGKAKQAELRDTARHTAQDLAETSKQRALQAQAEAENFVRTQPATALGIAAGLGFLVGMMTTRK